MQYISFLSPPHSLLQLISPKPLVTYLPPDFLSLSLSYNPQSMMNTFCIMTNGFCMCNGYGVIHWDTELFFLLARFQSDKRCYAAQEEPICVALPNGYIAKVPSKCLCLLICAVLNLGQRRVLLQRAVVKAENHNCSKCQE